MTDLSKTAPVITEEAVEAAAKAIYNTPHDSLSRKGYDQAPSDIRKLYLSEARAALEAAALLLGPRPLLAREAVRKELHGLAEEAAYEEGVGEEWVDRSTDAIMVLARPTPECQQIAVAIHGGYCGTAWDDCTDTDRMLSIAAARRVLALFNGGEK